MAEASPHRWLQGERPFAECALYPGTPEPIERYREATGHNAGDDFVDNREPGEDCRSGGLDHRTGIRQPNVWISDSESGFSRLHGCDSLNQL